MVANLLGEFVPEPFVEARGAIGRHVVMGATLGTSVRCAFAQVGKPITWCVACAREGVYLILFLLLLLLLASRGLGRPFEGASMDLRWTSWIKAVPIDFLRCFPSLQAVPEAHPHLPKYPTCSTVQVSLPAPPFSTSFET